MGKKPFTERFFYDRKGKATYDNFKPKATSIVLPYFYSTQTVWDDVAKITPDHLLIAERHNIPTTVYHYDVSAA